MYFARYRSSRPLDHLPRTLDTLRRMGFAPRRIVMDIDEAGCTRIEVVYQPAGHLEPATFVERLRVMPGVDDIAHGRVDALRDPGRAETAVRDMAISADRLDQPELIC